MILKNSSFNLSLIREVLRRQLWTITLSSISLFLALPLPVIMTIQNALTQMEKTTKEASSIKEVTASSILFILSIDNIFLKILLITLAIISGIAVFSHLHSKEKTDFYHSLPISRNKLFVTRFISGILTILPAYLINYLLSITIATSFGFTSELTFNVIMQALITTHVFFLAIYATSCLCAILCGNTIISMLLLAWLSFSPSVCILWSNLLKETFYKTFVSGSILLDNLTIRLSPIIQFLFTTSKTFDDQYSKSLLLSPGSTMWMWLLIYFAAFIIVTLLALWLNRLRYSEKACSAIAFDKFKTPLKYYMVTLTAIGMGLLFKEIVNPFWMYIGFFLGGLLCHMIVEITYHFDFRAIFKNIKWFAVFSVIFSLFITGMYFDITGFDRYTPNPESLHSVNLTLDNYLNYSYTKRDYPPLKDPQNIALACKLAELGVAQINNNNEQDYTNDENKRYSYLEVTYDKKFGVKKTRAYKIIDDAVLRNIIDKIRYSEEYIKNRLPLFTFDETYNDVLFFLGPEDMDYNTNPIVNLNASQIKEIVICAREEWLTLTPEYLAKTAPVALMYFDNSSNLNRKDEKYKYSPNYYSDTRIPLYPSFTKTLSLIKKYSGFKPTPITIDQVSSVTMHYNNKTFNDDEKNLTYVNKEITITNSLDIAVILQKAIPSNLAYSSDPNFKVSDDYTINIKLKNSLSEISMVFPSDNIPHDVIERNKD